MQLAADGGYLVTGLAIHAMIHPLQVPLWIDLTSVIVAALAGAAVAVEERFDPLGGILLAMVMGLGGGIIRDLLLGLRPVAVTSHYYLPAVTVAALGGYVFASLLRLGTPFVVLDAMATGLFTVVGVEKALLYDLPDVSAIFIGVAAAVGGGLFVDLIAGRPVGVVHRGPWNATAALAGAAFYTVVADLDAPIGFRQAATLAVVVAMRLALCVGACRRRCQTTWYASSRPDAVKAMRTFPRTSRGETPQYGTRCSREATPHAADTAAPRCRRDSLTTGDLLWLVSHTPKDR
jgi:uncharacterized membrane protein YeiH